MTSTFTKYFTGKYSILVLGTAVIIGLYILSRNNYLLFHSLAEVFSIVIAFAIFIVAWNTRRSIDSHYILFLGIAYLFVGAMDLLHTLAYTGMGVFVGYGTNLTAQLWIIARYFESLSILLALLFISRRLNTHFALAGYLTASSLLLASIFAWEIFPTAFIEGTGLTLFKKISEYVISFVLLTSLYFLYIRRILFDRKVFLLLSSSIAITVASELSFTLYTDPFGLPNLIGHFLKIVSFYLIYKAIIETGLVNPFDLMFRNLKQSEEALQQSEKHYSTLVNSISDAILEIKDGRIVWCNEKAKDIYGYEIDELQGKAVSILYPEDLEASYFVKKASNEIRSSGQFRGVEKIRRKDGELAHIEYVVTPISRRDPSTMIAIARDITERKSLEDAVRYALAVSEQVFDTSAAAMRFVDMNFNVLRINNSFSKLCYRRKEEAVGEKCYQSFPGIYCHSENCPLIRIKNGETLLEYEVEKERMDGTKIHCLQMSAPFYGEDNELTGIVQSYMDISERHRLDELKDEFISLVSHELGSPLTVVIGAINTVLAEKDRLSPEETQQLLKDAASESENLSHLLGNLLELSRVQANRLNLYNEPINIRKVIEATISKVSMIYSNRQIQTNISRDLPVLWADALRLERIFYNLIENAIKYSSGDSKVKVFARYDDESIICGVSDKGPGLSVHDAARIFEPFERLEDTLQYRTTSKGMGLGLLVCRRLVEAHNGKIWVESTLGKGTKVFFRLPLH
jgi:PAS domain S-box-containing protein